VDVAVAYACGANAYVVKPLDLQRFMTVVRNIEEHWTGVVRLP
jgi:AmiR/NasT family two-component response regulator